MFRFITHRPLWVNFLAGFLVMVLCLFLLYLLLGPLTRHGKSRTVPNVIGKTYEDAKKILRTNGFAIEVQDSVYVDTARRGSVLRQIPEGDAVVKISRTVYLTVNRYVPPKVEMPNLIGFSYRNAELQLKNMGLRVGDTTFKPDFAKHSVLEQWHKGSPVAAGAKIQQGSVIDLVLSDGVGNTEFAVPDLIGKTFGEAKAMLESNGLSFAVVLPDPGITDTAGAFIYWQNPSRFDTEGKKLKIRSGQTMDVRLSFDKPVPADSLKQNQSGQ
jgi:beta-lactam-binding protein with PASTA domain